MAKKKPSAKKPPPRSRTKKAAPRAKPVERLFAATQSEVAEWFDVSVDTVARSWRKKGMPGDEGAWPLQDIAQWLAKVYGKRDSPAAEEAASARAFQLRQQGEFARLKKERLEGTLVELAQVQLEISEALILTGDQLLRVGADVLPILPADRAADIVQEIERRIRNCLVMLTDKLTEIAAGNLAADEDEGEDEDDGEL